MPNHDALEKEYFDVSANMRHYANMRFAQLTLTLAANGGLVASLVGHDKPLPDSAALLLKIFGIVVVAVFWVMEERAADYWHRFAARAEQIESIVGFEQYLKRPSKKVVTATNAVRFLHGTMLFGWVLVLISTLIPALRVHV